MEPQTSRLKEQSRVAPSQGFGSLRVRVSGFWNDTGVRYFDMPKARKDLASWYRLLHILDYTSSRKPWSGAHFRPPKPRLPVGLVIAQPTSETKIADFQVAVLVHLAHRHPSIAQSHSRANEPGRGNRRSAVQAREQCQDICRLQIAMHHVRTFGEWKKIKDEDADHGAGDCEGCCRHLC